MSIVDSYVIEALNEHLGPASLKGSWDMKDKSPRERLMALRDFLRTDVPNICWNFGSIGVNPECGAAGCAVGWYAFLTGQESAASFYDKEAGIIKGGVGVNDEFQLSPSSFWYLFTSGLGNKLGKPMSDISPSEVADAIDEYLENE